MPDMSNGPISANDNSLDNHEIRIADLEQWRKSCAHTLDDKEVLMQLCKTAHRRDGGIPGDEAWQRLMDAAQPDHTSTLCPGEDLRHCGQPDHAPCPECGAECRIAEGLWGALFVRCTKCKYRCLPSRPDDEMAWAAHDKAIVDQDEPIEIAEDGSLQCGKCGSLLKVSCPSCDAFHYDADQDELTEWPCQDMLGGKMPFADRAMCTHPECHPSNADQDEPDVCPVCGRKLHAVGLENYGDYLRCHHCDAEGPPEIWRQMREDYRKARLWDELDYTALQEESMIAKRARKMEKAIAELSSPPMDKALYHQRAGEKHAVRYIIHGKE